MGEFNRIKCPICGNDHDMDTISQDNKSRWNATRLVLKEVERQDRKWGIQSHSDQTWLAILTEEVGEVAEAILHTRFGGKRANKSREEVIQIAAVALNWLMCQINRAEYGDDELTIATEDGE